MEATRATSSRNRRRTLGLPSSSRDGRSSATSSDTEEHISAPSRKRERDVVARYTESRQASFVALAALTMLAFLLRFYRLNHPAGVVFDEVHFGKFASYYILREYYFDVHPPFAKLMLGLAGWFAGYDGHYPFESIGDNYKKANVPYVGIRALPALFGSLTIPLVYAIMKESGYPTIVAVFTASIVLFDNGHIAQSRLILLDGQLVFFTALSLYTYIRFRKLRYREFTFDWWFWLIASGVSLAATLGSKMVGLFTFLTIGTAVAIDLWDILDVRKGHSMDYFRRHFAARAIGLIIVPAIVYLSFFYVHFAILSHTGSGDAFMSPAFQETLIDNELLMTSQEIRYYDTVTMVHRQTKMYLHSHPEHYPLKYEDGRVSSAGQQVTGYPNEDSNNHWQIIPTKSLPDTGRGRLVRNNDVFQLLHVSTQTYLLTHDVASPLMPTNQEFTTVEKSDQTRYNDTLFQLHLLNGEDGDVFKSKSGYFKLYHVPTRVALWSHPEILPEWAFGQQEINGDRKALDLPSTWWVQHIIYDEFGPDKAGGAETRQPRKMNFFKKFAELQLLMLQHNAGLTASHPYASGPVNWPFSISGISFFTNADTKEQVYFIGNVVGWWVCVMALSIFVGIIGADLLARRRGIDPIPDPVRNRLWNSAGLFWMAWAYHYFPFYLMSRQLFIHHYLPAHLCSALVTGAIFNFILSESINYPISIPSSITRLRPRQYSDLGMQALVATLGFVVILIAMFLFIAPLTYGTPGLEPNEVDRRRLLSSWTLHFASKGKDS